jgi:hypothetical protein
MKEKQYTHSITFFTTVPMFQKIKEISDKKKISLSELMREIILGYLKGKE